ncbi:AraC family transcriptional regulator [Nitrosomonas aestuarii]|uniref:AraC family transcriptional regulator n=1 Tax=Nitrosomonas aestuarii TaxID=52441 RepID=UPI000D324805|nr:AraC family transcriptional regulator [Nitrosomonas aestuarii]PTN11043.1 AraC-like DNA-binding protein [Nitrosomonas aestuarii]
MDLFKNTYLDFPGKKRLHLPPKACAPIIQLAHEFNFGQSSSVKLIAQLLPNLKIYEIATTPYRHHPRPHITIDRNPEDLSLLISVNGPSVIRSGCDDPLYCLPGDALLMSSNPVLHIHTAGTIFLAVIDVSKVLITSGISNLITPLIKKITMSTTPGLGLLTGYLNMLIKLGENGLPAGIVSLASSQIQDMTALLLNAKREVLEIANGRNTRLARLKTIKNDIETHIADSDLTINQVAIRQGVSAQYIRALFRTEKTTFSEYVTKLRLQRICCQLHNPLYTRYSISALAFDMGFNNLSWFNRAFKTHFGMTPTELRNKFTP